MIIGCFLFLVIIDTAVKHSHSSKEYGILRTVSLKTALSKALYKQNKKIDNVPRGHSRF